MYVPQHVRSYYDELGRGEWERLDMSAHARLVLHLHQRFLRSEIGPGKRVLDAGSGAGRFAVYVAQAGSRVTLLDLSQEQLRIAETKLSEYGLLDRIDGLVVGDICDLGSFQSQSFHTVVCYGGALNYLFDRAESAVAELVRVTKPGGTLLVSVMSRWGMFRFTVANQELDTGEFFGRPSYWMIPQVADTGDLVAHPELRHPPRHFFDSAELSALLQKAGLLDIRIGCSPSLSGGLYTRLEQIEENPVAWDTVCQLEEKAYLLPGLHDAGEFLLARGKVPASRESLTHGH